MLLCYRLLKKYYKEDPVSDENEFILAGQMIQAEAVSHIINILHSRKFTCGGVLYWQYGESWGHTGYSPVDYYLRKKPAYYYIKRAYKPVNVVFDENGTNIVLLNDTLERQDLYLKFGVEKFNGEKLLSKEINVSIPADSNLFIESGIPQEMQADAFAYAVLLEEKTEISRARKFMNLPAADVESSIIPASENMDIMILKANTFQWCINLEINDKLDYSDNAFDLWPGETKTIYIHKTPGTGNIVPSIYSMNIFLGGKKNGGK